MVCGAWGVWGMRCVKYTLPIHTPYTYSLYTLPIHTPYKISKYTFLYTVCECSDNTVASQCIAI